jgi:hypothetical protein
MQDAVSKAERYRKEANRYGDLSKNAQPAYLGDVYRKPEPEDDGAALARLIARMNQIRERLRAQPDWKEPSEAECAEILARLDAEFGVRFPA